MTVILSEKNMESLLMEMSIEEKVTITTGGLPYGTKKMEKYGIPGALLNDSMAGINFRQLFADYTSMETGEGILESLRRCEGILEQLRRTNKINPELLSEYEMTAYDAIKKHLKNDLEIIHKVTSFPAGILLGATWNPELVYETAEALAREFDAFDVDVIMTPNVNIQRDPCGGRLFEGYSEDPYVTAQLGAEFVKGIQSVGILADPKHFAVNNHEKERKGINVHIAERALREIYFPGFEACIKKGKAKTIMSAYNKINGTACSENKELLTTLLRGEWGFDGMVISDWGGVYHSGDSLMAGNDLEMPAVGDRTKLAEDVKNGVVPEAVLDKAVRNILKTMLCMPCMCGHKYQDIDQEYSRKAAYNAVSEGVVLLKNENILPLSRDARINMQGEHVHQLMEVGGGSAEVLGVEKESFLQLMKNKAVGGKILDNADLEEKEAEYVLVIGTARGREGIDRANMLLEPEDQHLVCTTLKQAKVIGKKTILILNIAAPVDVSEYEEYADAILCIFVPGCMGSRALTDILYGDINPSGKLAITFPEKYEDCPSFGNFPGYNREVWYGEGIYVGYRYYDTKKIGVRYPFGFGLSYTTFAITELKAEKPIFEEEDVCFSVKIKNTGDRKGKEVVQIYIHHRQPTLQKPYKELKAFQKVELNPGEEKILYFRLEKEKLASYDEKFRQFTIEPGVYTIMAGNSSRSVFEEMQIVWKGKDPYGYSEESRFASVWADPRCIAIYEKYFSDKCGVNMYHDLLGYTPDYPVGKAIRERVPETCYESLEEKNRAVKEFFDELAALDLGKT